MKLPQGIVTRNKIRDAKICQLYATEGLTYNELAERFKVSSTRIGQIIYRNRALLVMDQQLEKAKRVNHLRRLLKNHPDKMEKKSTLDILESLRGESEGRDGQAQGGPDTKVIIIRETINKPAEEVDGNQDQGGPVPRQVSIIRA